MLVGCSVQTVYETTAHNSTTTKGGRNHEAPTAPPAPDRKAARLLCLRGTLFDGRRNRR
jgi:hypothetical protein